MESNDPSKLTIGKPANVSVAIYNGSPQKELMRFSHDGTVTVSPDLKADENARAVIDIIVKAWGAALAERIWNRDMAAAPQHRRIDIWDAKAKRRVARAICVEGRWLAMDDLTQRLDPIGEPVAWMLPPPGLAS